MGRKKKEDPMDYLSLPALDIDPEIKKHIVALLIILAAIISALSLFGIAGAIGTYWNQGSMWLLGSGRWLLPLLLLAWGVFILFKEQLVINVLNYIGLFLIFLVYQSFLQLIIKTTLWETSLEVGQGGGHLGWLVAVGLFKGVGLIGAFVCLTVLLLIGLMFLFKATLAHLWARGGAPIRFILTPFVTLFGLKKLGKGKKDEEEKDEDEAEDEDEENEEDNDEDNNDEEDNDEESDEDETDEEKSDTEAHIFRPMMAKSSVENLNIWKPSHIKIDIPLELMSKKVGKPLSGDIKTNKEIIHKTLAQFGIEVEMGEVLVGPTVAQYTLRPADGVKVSRITALNSDLAMALSAQHLRIEAPIPGKSLVGIEVPNKNAVTVGLSEVLTSNEYQTRTANMMIPLGKDVAGKVWLANLCKMPHLLVAGQTGSGKSVMLNTLIISLLYQNNPDDLRMIMVDPKRVELTMYNGIPHLLTPVITEVSKTVNALKWCLNELDRRLRVLEQAKKKDIASYNQNAKQRMPYIVFVIDELADLMIVAGKEVETGIVRLAQLARAVGIHLVLATQRPSVNVITGVIKANMPARIAFAVVSGIDSRTILDSLGAEKLLGKGDMLFTDPSMAKPRRIQGSFVSEQEIKKIVNYIKSNAGHAEYMDGITDRQKVQGVAGVGIDGAADDDDDMFLAAVEVVLTTKRASTTSLQTRLGLGYPRAAKIMAQMEDKGIIGPSNGAKPREILITKEQFDNLHGGGVSGVKVHKQSESVAPDEYLPGTDDFGDNEDEEENEDEDDETVEEDSFEEDTDEEMEEMDEADEEISEAEEEEEDNEDDDEEDEAENEDEEGEDEGENDEELERLEQQRKTKKSPNFDRYFSR
ncbi:DNA translocase FtsK [Candidatus Falkowbacteria bacterium]|nr:DNA translocase FtsK [Candidatus Falkowbacteria bacterium]